MELKEIVGEDCWEIIEKYGILSSSWETIIFVGKKKELLDYINKIGNILEFDNIIGGDLALDEHSDNDILRLDLDYSITDKSKVKFYPLFYTGSLKPNEKILERFNYSKDALKYVELPISLEYKIKSNPLLDWNEEVSRYLIKEE
jgi:hypothetical protein